MNLDPKTGRFTRTPTGQKTPRMREIEKRLGRTLEEDYKDIYLDQKLGQKKLANRWGVKKELIFRDFKSGRRSWVQMLGLEVRRHRQATVGETVNSRPKSSCEVCRVNDVALDKAHWVAAKEGGPARQDNLLFLCPNCHRKLDSHDETTIRLCGEVLLVKVAKRLLPQAEKSDHARREFFRVVKAIVIRRND